MVSFKIFIMSHHTFIRNWLFAGLNQEGIFRINGNSRIVERIRASYDRTGEADLTDGGDIMAVAGALKLYLRELPEAIIPEGQTRTFVTTQEGEYYWCCWSIFCQFTS